MAINVLPTTQIDVRYLEPPPEPWACLAALGVLYALGDVSAVGSSAVADFLSSHPVVVAKVGRKRHIVVGQFRAWEIFHAFAHLNPGYFKFVPAVVASISEQAIPSTAAENLFLEGLLLSLSPEYSCPQLANIWSKLPKAVRERVLPSVGTQAGFAQILGYESRTGFDRRQLNRIAVRLPPKAGEVPPLGDAREPD